jgi:glyoxylase-like metal-dependent hydrolase (beta-lactamase superfamily II)
VHDGHVHIDTTDLGHDVFMMDTRMGGYDSITSSYLIRGSRPCLVETGTARSAPVVIEQLQRLGVGPEDLASIVVTHIHLDHAGGVGDLARAFPNAQIVVQERGARHLADPSRLVASAHRVFGEAMDRLFGDLLPTAPERIVAIGERGTVDLGDGRRLDAFHNPGHASHHIGLVDSATGDLYTGDAAGVYVPQTADVRPATPPPDFNLDLTLSSLAAMRAVQPSRLLFSHFGPVTAVDETLDASVDELHTWVDTVRLARQVSPDVDHAVAMVKEQDRQRHVRLYEDPELLAAQEELSGTQANVAGIMRWLDLQAKD